jgi:WD40 repeat protein
MQVLSIPKKKRIYAIAFSPSGRDLAAISGDGMLRIWDTTTGELRQFAGVEETSCGFDLLYLNDDTIIVAGRELARWHLRANDWETIEPGMRWARQLAISPDQKYLAEVDQTQSTDWPNSGLLVHDAIDWHAYPMQPDAANTSGGMAFSPDGKLLATSHIIRVGEKERSLGPDWRRYTTNDYDYVVRLRELPGCATVRTIAGWGQGVRYLAFSPDRMTLAGTAGPRLRIWDLQNDREIAAIKRGPKHFQGIAFMADGRFAATVSNDETVRVWDAQSWAEVTTFTWDIGRLLNIEFAPDGLRAAAGSDKGRIVIWDVEA